MDAKIQAAYEDAPRFDEGELYHSEEYDRESSERLQLFDLMVKTFGGEIFPLLEAYTNTLFDEMGLESLHFFEQGYLAGQKS